MTFTMAGKHALVLGASGITGWAVVNELLTDRPDARRFTRVTALANRPLPADVAGWPEGPKLGVVSGIDLLEGSREHLEERFEARIPEVETVTHVFFNCQSSYLDMWESITSRY